MPLEVLTCIAYPTGRYDRTAVPAMLAVMTIVNDPRQKPTHRLFLADTVDTSLPSLPLAEHPLTESRTWNAAGANAIVSDIGSLYAINGTFGLPLLLWTGPQPLDSPVIMRRYLEPNQVRRYIEDISQPAVLMLRTRDLRDPDGRTL